jgi:hypothetical protein
MRKSLEALKVQRRYTCYPAKQEVYRATPQRNPLTQAKEWIIRGPYAIDQITPARSRSAGF